MVDRGTRACTWLRGPQGGPVSIGTAGWWLALTRNSRTMRFRTERRGRVPLMCRVGNRAGG